MGLDFRPFGHLDWIFQKTRPRYDLSWSSIDPDWSGVFDGSIGTEMLKQGSPAGMVELRDLVADIHGVESDRVLITNGTSEANYLAMISLLGKGSRVVVEKPTYTPLIEIPRGLGARVSFIKRRPDDYMLDLSELNGKLDDGADLVVISNLNNPTGKALFEHHLKEVASVCEAHRVPLLVDEVYRDFTLSPGPEGRLEAAVPSIVGLYRRGIATSSLSKTYGCSGLMAGWLIGPKRLINRAGRVKKLLTPMVSMMLNGMALGILRARGSVLPGAFSELREKLRLVQAWAAGRDDVHWSEPDGSAVGFLRYEYDIPSLEAAEMLYERYETKVIPGHFFHQERGFRIGLGVPYEEVKGGLARIDGFLDDRSGEVL